MSVTEAVDAILKLNPHPNAYARGTYYQKSSRWAFPIVKSPLTRELAELHVRGKRLLGAVGSDPDGFTTTVGLDLDKHVFEQDPIAAAKKFIQVASALDMPVLVHTSKSGKGLHIRTVFREMVPVHEARALYLSILLQAHLHRDAAVDKVWPPPHGLGVLAFPYNARLALQNGGTLALNPFTLQVLGRSEQMTPVLDALEPDLAKVRAALAFLGVTTFQQAEFLSAGTLSRIVEASSANVARGTDKGIGKMLTQCRAVWEMVSRPTEVSGPFWWSMMTNFRPFAAGYDIFCDLSEQDPARFDIKEIDKRWFSIKGGPVNCENLEPGWTCPNRDRCKARSPAGLVPRGLR